MTATTMGPGTRVRIPEPRSRIAPRPQYAGTLATVLTPNPEFPGWVSVAPDGFGFSVGFLPEELEVIG